MARQVLAFDEDLPPVRLIERLVSIPPRDCVAEFGLFAALVGATLAKIGNEIYQLQRPEIGEIGEAVTEAQMGSLTMPQKRNPERSEQLVTLGRLLRSYVTVLLEGVATEHERDGRSWKAERVALSDLCCVLLQPSLGLPGAYAAVRQAAEATEAGHFDHLSETLADVAPDAPELGRLRDPGNAVTSAAALTRAWLSPAT